MHLLEKKLELRNLLRKDLRRVTWLDKESGLYVGDYLFNLPDWEEESDVYGLFQSGKLVAYFTIEEMMEGTKGFEGLPDMKEDSLYLNNVYVKYTHRGQGLGLLLIDEIIKLKNMPIFLIAKTESLVDYYEKIGFSHIGEQCMVKYPEEYLKLVI